MDRRGFTLIELIMVIVLLGILAAVAIPKYVGLATEAKEAAEDGVVAAVRASLAIYYAEWLAKGSNDPASDGYPVDLETVDGPAAPDADDFFEGILQNGVKAKQGWSEGSSNNYTGPAGGPYKYYPAGDPNEGKFE